MKLIINADDFGMSETVNSAIIEGLTSGILTSTTIMANMPAFESGIKKLSELKNVGTGVHLNIIEYKTIQKNLKENSKLYDKNGCFNNGFIQMLLKSYDKSFMAEVEQEFRQQIEAVLKYIKPDHLDSHVHTHGIPKIFELVCKLAKEYDIPKVRTQYEYIYQAKNHSHFSKPAYYINFIKIFLLNTFTIINRNTAKKYGIKTNDCVIGVGYTSMMDSNTIKYGIDKLKNTNKILEVICHPDMNKNRKSNLTEYKAVLDESLKAYISEIEKISYKDL